MCLAIPGKIVAIEKNELGMQYGKVEFGGVFKKICLDLVPDARIGQYVVAHAGLALNLVNEDEALEIFKLIEQLDISPQDE